MGDMIQGDKSENAGYFSYPYELSDENVSICDNFLLSIVL